jgi:hypothetical protein
MNATVDVDVVAFGSSSQALDSTGSSPEPATFRCAAKPASDTTSKRASPARQRTYLRERVRGRLVVEDNVEGVVHVQVQVKVNAI